MELAELCEKLTRADHLDATKKAIVILWSINRENPGRPMTAYALAQTLSKHRLGNPNREVLTRGLTASPFTLRSGHGFVLKAGADETVSGWLTGLLGIAPFRTSTRQLDIFRSRSGTRRAATLRRSAFS